MSFPEAWLRSMPPAIAQALGAAPITWAEREAKARLEADEYFRLREAEKAARLAYLQQLQNTHGGQITRPAPKPALPAILETDQPRRFEFEG